MTAQQAFVINRAVDVARRAHFFNNLPAGFQSTEVIEAVDASASGFFDPQAWGRLYRGTWWGNPGVKPGAFACFVSHAQTWQKIVDNGTDRALIFEDDALVQSDIASAIEEWPPEADIVFFNHRIDTWTRGLPGGRRDPNRAVRALERLAGSMLGRSFELQPQVHKPQPIGVAFQNLIRRNWKPGRDVEHPGGEAYGLTRAGAERLLAWMDKTGITFGVDWFLVASGLALTDLQGGGETVETVGAAKYLKSILGQVPMQSVFISGRPCVRHFGAHLGGSVINHHRRWFGAASD